MPASEVTEIKFVRSGGFAGAATTVAGTVQFDKRGARVIGESTSYHRDLTAEEAESVRRFADPRALDSAKAAVSGAGAIRDGYQYDITVVAKDGKSHSLTLGEDGSDQLQATAPEVAELRSWIQDEAQKIWKHRINVRKQDGTV